MVHYHSISQRFSLLKGSACSFEFSVHLLIHLYFLLSNRSNMILICAISLLTLNWSTSLTVCLTTSLKKNTADCSPNTVIDYICFLHALHACAISKQPKTWLFGCSAVRLIVFPETHRHLNQSRTANRQPKPTASFRVFAFFAKAWYLGFSKCEMRQETRKIYEEHDTRIET